MACQKKVKRLRLCGHQLSICQNYRTGNNHERKKCFFIEQASTIQKRLWHSIGRTAKNAWQGQKWRLRRQRAWPLHQSARCHGCLQTAQQNWPITSLPGRQKKAGPMSQNSCDSDSKPGSGLEEQNQLLKTLVWWLLAALIWSWVIWSALFFLA